MEGFKLKIPVAAAPRAGHQVHDQGCGRHRDRRTKRRKTRQAQRASAIKDQYS